MLSVGHLNWILFESWTMWDSAYLTLMVVGFWWVQSLQNVESLPTTTAISYSCTITEVMCFRSALQPPFALVRATSDSREVSVMQLIPLQLGGINSPGHHGDISWHLKWIVFMTRQIGNMRHTMFVLCFCDHACVVWYIYIYTYIM